MISVPRRPMRLPSLLRCDCGLALADSPDAATLFLGGEDDFDAAMPAAFAFVAALMGWPSCFVVDRPAAATPVFAALSGLSALLCCAFRVSAATFWDGFPGVAQLGLGPVIVASWGCFQLGMPRCWPRSRCWWELLQSAAARALSTSGSSLRVIASLSVRTRWWRHSGHGRVRHPGGGSRAESGRARAHAHYA